MAKVPDGTEKVVVQFAGEGAGRGGLSWGQQLFWREFELMGAPIWLTGFRPAPPGSTIADAAGELAFVMSRNQSMRTRIEQHDDQPVQVVYDSGEICLQVLDVASGDDPRLAAQELTRVWKEQENAYDFAADWPVRMAVVSHRGKPAFFVRGTSHIVTDGFGALAMHSDVLARDPVTGSPSGPNLSMEPLEQAAWQAGPSGDRCTRLAERHWERLLRAIPARRFGDFPRQDDCQFGQLTFDSRAAFLATQAIAARIGVTTSAVLLAAVAVGMARATGINPIVPRLYVSNRFRPRLAATVSPISQTCPCVIDVAGATFDEAVRRASSASLSAYKNAYYDTARIRAVVAAIGAERGEKIDLSFIYNDIRMSTPRHGTSSIPSQAEIQAAGPLTSLTWEDLPELEAYCNLDFMDSPDTTRALLIIDTEYISRAAAQTCLREMEAILVAAAHNPAADTGI